MKTPNITTAEARLIRLREAVKDLIVLARDDIYTDAREYSKRIAELHAHMDYVAEIVTGKDPGPVEPFVRKKILDRFGRQYKMLFYISLNVDTEAIPVLTKAKCLSAEEVAIESGPIRTAIKEDLEQAVKRVLLKHFEQEQADTVEISCDIQAEEEE